MDEIFDRLGEDLVFGQEQKLLAIAQKIVPHVTLDDLWQPNDFPSLEEHPEFRYEEGVLHGIRIMITALRAKLKESDG